MVAEITPARPLPINPAQSEERKGEEAEREDISAMGNLMLCEDEAGEKKLPANCCFTSKGGKGLRWEINKGFLLFAK